MAVGIEGEETWTCWSSGTFRGCVSTRSRQVVKEGGYWI